MSGQRWLLPFQLATGTSALQQTHLLWLQGKVNLESKDCNQLELPAKRLRSKTKAERAIT